MKANLCSRRVWQRQISAPPPMTMAGRNHDGRGGPIQCPAAGRLNAAAAAVGRRRVALIVASYSLAPGARRPLGLATKFRVSSS